MLPASNYPLRSLFTESSFSWFGLILALGDILAVSLYCRLLCALEKEFKLNISLMKTTGKGKYHVHSKIKHKCPLKLLVVLNYVCYCFIYINEVDYNRLHAIILKRHNALWRKDKP